MADQTYTAALEALVSTGHQTSGLNLATAEVRALIVRDYTFSDSHEFLDDLTGAGGEVVDSAELTNKSFTGGVFDADDALFEDVPAGDPITSYVIVQWTDTDGDPVADSARRLVRYIDESPDLPKTPVGIDILVQWDDTDGVLRLTSD